MSTLTNNNTPSDDNTSVTNISANARIDYILRFSKQAILVIDESAQQNAQIINQVIATIPEQHNAAYVSLSTQFDDIQIRCRIIEQLCSGELFDPEISLAVSIINIAKKPLQAISIVLDHAEHLSLQLLHEMTQISEIAKKSDLVIDIIMFGSPEAGNVIQDNKKLFHNKLSLLSAQSGQLLSANAAIFQRPKEKWYATGLNKWLLSAIIFLILLSITIVVLLQQDSFNFTKAINNDKKTILSEVLVEPQTTVLNKNDDTSVLATESPQATELEVKATTTENTEEIIAESSKDITATVTADSLPNESTDNVTDNIKLTTLEPTTTELETVASDIESSDDNSTLDNSTLDSSKPDSSELDNSELDEATIVQSKPVKNETSTLADNQNSINVDFNYYLEQKSGVVIQLGAYSNVNFIDDFKTAGISIHVYKKLLNGKAIFIITSSIYADLVSAEQALSTMPEFIKAQQPWVKPINVIHQEINKFKNTD